jgi:DNA repair protein RecO (recombination protein O)
MTLERATGIVLRTRPLTETSLIVHWLTADLGRVATVAKGARRPQSAFRGQIDLFYVAEFSFVRSRRSELHTLRESRLLNANALLRRDLEQLEQAAYCARMIEQSTETESPMPGLYHTFSKLLEALPHQPAQPQALFAFEMKFLDELGLAPDLTEVRISPGSRMLLEKFITLEWPEIFRIKLSEAQSIEIRHFLHGFIIYHLERIPKTPRSRS